MNESIANVAGCFACEQFILPMPASAVSKTDNIPLCTRHWNWWIIRWLNADTEPPCGAHLMPGKGGAS